MTSYSIRGELVQNNKDGKANNIYWSTGEETAQLEWIGKDTVIINGHALKVPD